jgi:hypothetical protein
VTRRGLCPLVSLRLLTGVCEFVCTVNEWTDVGEEE